MIVLLHVATGALAGAAAGSPLGAFVLGPVIHLVGDAIPHDDIDSVPFEVRTGVAGVLAVALVRGPLHPATVGAAAAAAPDLEHVLRVPRPGGRKIFPSHRFAGWHREGGLPVWLQLVAAGTILGALLAPGSGRAAGRRPSVTCGANWRAFPPLRVTRDRAPVRRMRVVVRGGSTQKR